MNGWAVDPDDPTAPVTVQVFADGAVVAEVEAVEYRQDIVDAGIDPDGTAGFWIDLGPLVSSDESHTDRHPGLGRPDGRVGPTGLDAALNHLHQPVRVP